MIVITGGAGFIGSVLAWKFNEVGEKNLIVVDQRAKGSPKWDNIKKRAWALYLESDEFIRRLENKEFNGKIRAVFHMGACSDTAEKDREYLRKNNTEYSRRIAEWSVQNKVYLAYASSAAVYGDGSRGFSDENSKAFELEPLNPYGRSKLDFDLWALKNGFDKKITGFRFFNVYGPNEYHKGHMRSVVHSGFEQIARTGKIRLFKSYRKEYPDGGQKRDFVYVKDAVDAVIWFYKNPLWKGIYNLGSGRAQTWNDLADGLFKAMGVPKKIEYFDMPEDLKNQYQYFTEADMGKFGKTGCPAAFLELERGISDYVRNYLLQKDPCL